VSRFLVFPRNGSTPVAAGWLWLAAGIGLFAGIAPGWEPTVHAQTAERLHLRTSRGMAIAGSGAWMCSDEVREETMLWPVLVKGRLGYMDKSGGIAIEPQFSAVGLFSEGLAAVGEERENAIGVRYSLRFINAAGKAQVSFDKGYPEGGEFSEGLAPVYLDKGWGYVDRTGAFRVEPQFGFYPYAGRFSEGLACVKIGKQMGYIDRSGHPVIPPQYKNASEFRNGLAAVQVGNRWGFIDRSGKLLIPAQFDQAGCFCDDLAPVKVGKKWGYIDKTGKLAIAPQFESARNFSRGDRLAAVKLKGKWGYIDPTAKVAVGFSFDMADHFSEGLAGVEVGGKWGFIDPQGKMVIPPQFDAAYPFWGGLALVSFGRVGIGGPLNISTLRLGYIDKTGRYVWEPRR